MKDYSSIKYLNDLNTKYQNGIDSENSWLDLINDVNSLENFCKEKNILLSKHDLFELKCINNDIKEYNMVFALDSQSPNQSWFLTVKQCSTDFASLMESISYRINEENQTNSAN